MELCRAQGAISIEVTDVGYKILFGAPPAPKGAKVEMDPRSARRDHYDILLGRKHTDAELDELP